MDNAEKTNARFRISSSPHIQTSHSTRSIMLDVIIALMPAALCSVIFFGYRSAAIIIIAVISAVATEALIQRSMKKTVTIDDLSAVLTGLLLAFNLPAGVPLWIPAIGSFIAVALVKQMFGGIGQNFVNPALAARAILLASFTGFMSGAAFTQPVVWTGLFSSAPAVDALSSATPLVAPQNYAFLTLIIGNRPGCLGETGTLALLVGAGYLFYRKIITWHTPVTFIGTVLALSLFTRGFGAFSAVFSGGLILGAFFMATDYATSPTTPLGRIIMGIGCGILAFVIRTFNPAYPEGVSYAILLMNLAVPLIDKYTRPRIYGEVTKKHA